MTDCSATAIANRVLAGRVTARSVVEAAFADIARRDGQYNSFRELHHDAALAAADEIDRKRLAGLPLGRLAGVPFAIKELFDVAGRRTLAGSRLREDALPAEIDAEAVRALKAEDAVLLGTLNMDEFAYGFSTENQHYGVTRNPHDPTRIAGGSSGGSAAAVAAGLVPLTLGSDTNGSIRVPAALCGIYGVKPTYGRLSCDGVTPFVGSLDHVGYFANTAADLRLADDCLAGPGSGASSAPLDSGTLRVGLLGGWFRQGGTPEVFAALDQIARAFANVRPVELPEVHRARSAAFCITASEAGNLHMADLRRAADRYDDATRERLLAGAMLPAHLVAESQRFRGWFRDRVREVFDSFDILLAPATPCAAPQVGQREVVIDGKPVIVRANLGIYTQPISFIGLPVVTVPVGLEGQLPLGVQLIGKPWSDTMLLEVAEYLENEGVCGVAPPRMIAA